MCKPEKVLSQQTEIKDNLKNLPFWGFTLTSISYEELMERDGPVFNTKLCELLQLRCLKI